MRLGVAPKLVNEALASHDGAVALSDGRLVARGIVDSAADRAAALVGEHHRRFPLDTGLPLAALRTGLGVAAGVVELALGRLAASGALVVEGAIARLAAWNATLGPADSAIAAALQSRLEAAGREPPSVSELAAAIGADPRPVLRFLERTGDVIAIEEDRYYLGAELREMERLLATGMLAGRVYSPAELRELTGLSRKYLIPFLEHCDRRGLTARQDSGRIRAGT